MRKFLWTFLCIILLPVIIIAGGIYSAIEFIQFFWDRDYIIILIFEILFFPILVLFGGAILFFELINDPWF